MATASEIAKRCKDILASHYGPKFGGVVLYGSAARGQEDPGSDIDLLVLLRKPFDYFRELRHSVDLLYPIQLDSEHLISAKPADEDEFGRGVLQLYRNAQREGRII